MRAVQMLAVEGGGGAAVLRCGRAGGEFVQLGKVRVALARGRSSTQRRIVATTSAGGRGGRRSGGERFVAARAVASAYPLVAQTEKTFRLPIDYYQILGAEPQYLADAIVRAFESRVNNPPREGFSQQALIARLEILRGARDTLVDSAIRAEYDQALAEDEADTLILDVPWTKVGGALCLLNEVREAEVVLQAGQALLSQQQEHLPKTLHRDVVLAMALSHVELSREAMDESPQAVDKSCSFLESALKALREVGGRPLALDLQDQIEGTLDELAARCVLELLALPLDKEHEMEREQGLQGLRTLLWTVDEASGNRPFLSGFTREQLMTEAFSLMTAAEQVSLFTETPESIPADSSELYAAALALVAEGFLSKTPSLIQDAEALFSQLQQSTDSECAFERGICALLLGEVADCRTWLGLEDKNSPFRDSSVVSYVYSYSGEEGDDSLPGLCKLLEGWLSEMVLPRFRNTEESVQVQLTDYFDDPGVLSYLEGLEKGNGSHMAAAAAIVRIGAGAGAALKATLKKVFPVEEPLPRRDFQQFVAHRGTDGDPSFNGFQDWDSSEEEQEEESSVKDRQPGFGALKIACSGLVFGALVMAGLRFLPQYQRVAQQLLRSAPLICITGVRQREAVEKEEVPQMDARLAELTVRKWQAAKARALGATHDVVALPEVLEGEMLRSWASRASDVKRHGWYWQYTLLGLTIDSLTLSDDGTRATAEATLQETATLVHRNHPDHTTDSYTSTYITRYDLRRGADGWRISAGAVLRT